MPTKHVRGIHSITPYASTFQSTNFCRRGRLRRFLQQNSQAADDDQPQIKVALLLTTWNFAMPGDCLGKSKTPIGLYVDLAASSLLVVALVLLGDEREPLCKAFTAEAVPIIRDGQHEV